MKDMRILSMPTSNNFAEVDMMLISLGSIIYRLCGDPNCSTKPASENRCLHGKSAALGIPIGLERAKERCRIRELVSRTACAIIQANTSQGCAGRGIQDRRASCPWESKHGSRQD
jgi:hypothetical protein